jgi:hypothetical protein
MVMLYAARKIRRTLPLRLPSLQPSRLRVIRLVRRTRRYVNASRRPSSRSHSRSCCQAARFNAALVCAASWSASFVTPWPATSTR